MHLAYVCSGKILPRTCGVVVVGCVNVIVLTYVVFAGFVTAAVVAVLAPVVGFVVVILVDVCGIVSPAGDVAVSEAVDVGFRL